MLRPVQRSASAAMALALLAAAAAAAGCGAAAYRGSSVSQNQSAPDFTARSLDGRTASLSGHQGKVVILFLWAAWECSDELAALDDIASRLSPQRLSVVAVSIDKNGDVVEKVARSRKRWTLDLLHEPTAEVARTYNPRGFPAAYVIDTSGTVRHAHYRVGRPQLRSIEAQARELMAEN